MNYLDVYFSRINHGGETTAERIRDGGIRSFERWLAESPHTIEDLSVERGLYFSGILLQNKDKEAKKLLFLNVANDIPIMTGDILNWRQDDGSVEKWLLLTEEKKVNGTYRTFTIIKCNYLIKWIDANGHLQSSWCYICSSTDEMVKGNFRTWHNLISPQPNKFAEVIMPRIAIDRGTNFIIEDESWLLVEFDKVSVTNVTYLYLTEDKVNKIYDDLNEDVAETDRLAHYRIDIPPVDQTFTVGQPIEPVYTLMKDGIPYTGEISWDTSDHKIARVIDGQLMALAEGTVDIIATLVDFPQISQSMTITINGAPQEFSAYIKGNDAIKLDRYSDYELIGTIPISGIEYHLEETDLATISAIEDNKCIIHANKKNKLGQIILVATYDGIDYTKEITIAPLW